MKYFKTKTEIRAIDTDQESLVEKDWVEITLDEVLFITNPPVSNEDIEKQRVSSIKSKAGELIETKYPIYKQLNITNLLVPYTEQDKEEMRFFIEGIRKIANDSISNGTVLGSIVWN